MSGTLTELLARYGYIFIALFLFIESIGIPVPGESALITAGAVAGSGALSAWGVFLAALLGNGLGGIASYWIGIRGGHAIVARFGRALRINDARIRDFQPRVPGKPARRCQCKRCAGYQPGAAEAPRPSR